MVIRENCSFRNREVDSQRNKRPKKNGGKGSVALLKNSRHFGCVFQDVGPPKLRKGTKFWGPLDK